MDHINNQGKISSSKFLYFEPCSRLSSDYGKVCHSKIYIDQLFADQSEMGIHLNVG